MAVLEIASTSERRGREILTMTAAEVEDFSDEAIQELIDDMLDTLAGSTGIGLAAPQVYRSLQIIIVSSKPGPEYENAPVQEPIVMINPRIHWKSPVSVSGIEGCLSIKDLRARVRRSKEVHVSFLDRTGKRQELRCEGLLARVVQHECDHLEGILFTELVREGDYLTDEELAVQ